MRISDWSSDVCSSDLVSPDGRFLLVDILFDAHPSANPDGTPNLVVTNATDPDGLVIFPIHDDGSLGEVSFADAGGAGPFYIAFLHGSQDTFLNGVAVRSEEHTSELQSLMRISYAVFFLQKKIQHSINSPNIIID